MLGLRDLDVRRARSNEPQKIDRVVGLEELRLAPANDRKRRARALDHRDRIEPSELLPEKRVEAQRPSRIALGAEDLPRRAPRDKVENVEVEAGLWRRKAEAGVDGLERGPHAVLPRVRPGRARIALVLGREKGRIDHHHGGEFVAEIMGEPARDAAAERVSNDDRRPGLEGAARTRGLPGLADKLAKIVSVTPLRTPHPAERRRDDAPFAGEEGGDEAPPIPMGGAAMQEYETRLAALAPGEGLDLSTVHADKRALGLDRHGPFEPPRRRGLLPAKSRKRRHGGRFGHANALSVQATSNSPAAPMPPPTHIVTTT